MAETKGLLTDKLLEIQSLGLNVAKSTEGYNYKYADLESVWNVLRPELTKRNILVEQAVTKTDSEYVLETTVSHRELNGASKSVVPLIGATDMQKLGSAITYARRYAILTMFNIITEDDDGRAASTPATVPANNGMVRSTQLKQLDDLLDSKGIDKDKRRDVIEGILGEGKSARDLTYLEAVKLHADIQQANPDTLESLANGAPF